MGLGFGVLMREARFATWIYEHFSYWVLVRVGWYWCTEPPPLTGPTISSALICAKWEVGGRRACLSVIADWSPSLPNPLIWTLEAQHSSNNQQNSNNHQIQNGIGLLITGTVQQGDVLHIERVKSVNNTNSLCATNTEHCGRWSWWKPLGPTSNKVISSPLNSCRSRCQPHRDPGMKALWTINQSIMNVSSSQPQTQPTQNPKHHANDALHDSRNCKIVFCTFLPNHWSFCSWGCIAGNRWGGVDSNRCYKPKPRGAADKKTQI